MNQNQFGASLGGPIRRDRTFFFSNFEQRALDQSGLVDDPAGQHRRHQRQADRDARIQGQPVTTGVYPNPVDSTNLLAKVDHRAERLATSSASATASTTSRPTMPAGPAP